MNIKGMITCSGKIWVAMSLEFGLAAQALSEKEAKQKLHNQIQEYFNEANGQDKAFQKQLLSRRSPFSWHVKYYWLTLKNLFKQNGHSFLFSASTSDQLSYAYGDTLKNANWVIDSRQDQENDNADQSSLR